MDTTQLEIPGTSPFAATDKHYHVGCNMVGYLPEGDIYCADNVQDAVEFFLSRLQDAQDECLDECGDSSCDDQMCEWCSLSREIHNIKSSAMDGTQDLHRRVLANGGYGYTYTPPEGADIHYWIEPQADSKADAHAGKFSRSDICEVMMEQNDLWPFDFTAQAQTRSSDYWGPGHYFIYADRTIIGMTSRDPVTGKWFAYRDYQPPTPGKDRQCVGSDLPTRDTAIRALWVAYKEAQ